jgi:hypothetical protein
MRHQRDQRPIRVTGRHADDERGTHLCRHAEVDQPDLATARRCHLRLLALIEFDEKAVGSGEQIVVGRTVVRRVRDSTREFNDQFRPFLFRKPLKFFKKLLRRLGHEISVPRCAVWVKYVQIPEV